MTALIVITLVLLSVLIALNLLIIAAADPEFKLFAAVQLIPMILAIIVLGIVL